MAAQRHSLIKAVVLSFILLAAFRLSGQSGIVACTWDSISTLAFEQKDRGEFDEAILNMGRALELAVSMDDSDLRRRSHTGLGTIHFWRMNNERAWLHWNKAMAIAEATQDQDAIAELCNNLGALYYQAGEHERAKEYFEKSLGIRKRIGSVYDVGVVLNNLASLEMDFGDPKTAISQFRRSMDVWSLLNDRPWMSLALSHIGTCHGKLGAPDSAKWYFDEALAQAGKEDRTRHMFLWKNLCEWHSQHGDRAKAISYCMQSLHLADSLNFLDVQIDNSFLLSGIHSNAGDHRQALMYHKRAVELRDATSRNEHSRELEYLRANMEYEKRHLADSLNREEEKLRSEMLHAAIVSKERNRRNLFIYATCGIFLLSAGLWQRLRDMRRSRELVLKERDRADDLLHNILPVAVANELMATGHSEAREYQEATILFTDFHGFTTISEQLSAKDLVSEIDACFTVFDGIMKKYGVEKIKTVGDCYMACGGVPDAARGTPADVVKAGLELQEFLLARGGERMEQGLPYFTMRVGIHTGPVVAGIVGTDKFAYDIWGDAVNIAARMENSGEVGKVNISAHTRELIVDDPELHTIPRGMVQTKGKGKLQMYFVEKRQLAMTADADAGQVAQAGVDL